jgi:hypothetical protein
MSEQLIKNRSEMLHVPIGTLAKYRAEELHRLLFQVSEELERVKRTRQWIEAAIAMKYEEQICAKRLRLEKDSGVIHLEDDGFRVTGDVAKKVEWDQKKLQKVIADLMAKGVQIDNYVDTIYHVPESKFNEWSTTLQSVFTIARNVKHGTAKYKLTKLNDGGGL